MELIRPSFQYEMSRNQNIACQQSMPLETKQHKQTKTQCQSKIKPEQN